MGLSEACEIVSGVACAGVGRVTESVGTSMKPGYVEMSLDSESVGASLMPKSTKVGLVSGSTGGVGWCMGQGSRPGANG